MPKGIHLGWLFSRMLCAVLLLYMCAKAIWQAGSAAEVSAGTSQATPPHCNLAPVLGHTAYADTGCRPPISGVCDAPAADKAGLPSAGPESPWSDASCLGLRPRGVAAASCPRAAPASATAARAAVCCWVAGLQRA